MNAELQEPADLRRIKMSWFWCLAFLSYALLVLTLTPIIAHNRNFIDSSAGTDFKLLGLHYQNHNGSSSDRDSFSDPDACLRDAAMLQRLGVNTIHITALNPALSHDECMSIFDYAGIYVTIGLDTDGDNLKSGSTPEDLWTETFMLRALHLVDAFMNYDNLLGVIVMKDYSWTGKMTTFPTQQAYIRAAVRDIKNYIAKYGTRTGGSVPVGITASFFSQVQPPPDLDLLGVALPLVECGIDGTIEDTARVDFVGGEAWAVSGTPSQAGAVAPVVSYDQLLPLFKILSTTSVVLFVYAYRELQIPANLTGHTELFDPTDNFTVTQRLYTDQFLDFSFAGGLAIQWANTDTPRADYGIVELDSDDSLQLRPAYDNFAGAAGLFNVTALRNGPVNSETSVVLPCSIQATTIYTVTGSDSMPTTVTFGTSWSLPSPFPTVQAVIDSGLASGTRGRLVDVTRTVVDHTVRDSEGSIISGLSVTAFSSPGSTSSPAGTITPEAGSTSTGTKIGLGVGIPIGIFAIVGVVVFIWLKKRRQGKITPYDKPELPGSSTRNLTAGELGHEGSYVELPGQIYPRAELETIELAVKADGTGRSASDIRFELPADDKPRPKS